MLPIKYYLEQTALYKNPTQPHRTMKKEVLSLDHKKERYTGIKKLHKISVALQYNNYRKVIFSFENIFATCRETIKIFIITEYSLLRRILYREKKKFRGQHYCTPVVFILTAQITEKI